MDHFIFWNEWFWCYGSVGRASRWSLCSHVIFPTLPATDSLIQGKRWRQKMSIKRVDPKKEKKKILTNPPKKSDKIGPSEYWRQFFFFKEKCVWTRPQIKDWRQDRRAK